MSLDVEFFKGVALPSVLEHDKDAEQIVSEFASVLDRSLSSGHKVSISGFAKAEASSVNRAIKDVFKKGGERSHVLLAETINGVGRKLAMVDPIRHPTTIQILSGSMQKIISFAKKKLESEKKRGKYQALREAVEEYGYLEEKLESLQKGYSGHFPNEGIKARLMHRKYLPGGYTITEGNETTHFLLSYKLSKEEVLQIEVPKHVRNIVRAGTSQLLKANMVVKSSVFPRFEDEYPIKLESEEESFLTQPSLIASPFAARFGPIPKDEAEELLGGYPEGMWLLRESSTKDVYLLSIRNCESVVHMGVFRNPQGEWTASGGEECFSSLEDYLFSKVKISREKQIKPWSEDSERRIKEFAHLSDLGVRHQVIGRSEAEGIITQEGDWLVRPSRNGKAVTISILRKSGVRHFQLVFEMGKWYCYVDDKTVVVSGSQEKYRNYLNRVVKELKAP